MWKRSGGMTQDARRVLLERLIDDAGLFPPARKPMADAVADHRAARGGPHAWMLGRFLCPAARLEELAAAGPDDDWRLGAIGDGVPAYDGPGTIDAIELKFPAEVSGVPRGVELFMEAPAGELEAIAVDGRAGAKIRCGGLTADAFPADEAVAEFISGCVRLGLRFKATAGLHHPFRTRDEEIGVLQHGFVNLLAATALPDADTVAIIGEADPGAFSLDAGGLRWRDAVAGTDALARARELFTAYGSCSFDEPVADLVAHGVLEEARA
jgi:hypothetical protein